MKRTLEHCGLITKMGDKGTGYPRQTANKCQGYAVSREDDEPCETCKNCRYNEFYEE